MSWGSVLQERDPAARSARKVQALRERYKAFENAREGHGLTLLPDWLSPEQQAQFDTSKSFDVIGCDSGKRYRIRYGTGTNIIEMNAGGEPVMSWCFIPSGYLVAGDVMLAPKIALETNEHAALAVANKSSIRAPNPSALPRRAY